jgi:hypothetical protein
MTLSIRLNNRLALCSAIREDQLPAIARALAESMAELRLYAKVLVTCTVGNVTSIVYSH